jgi:hypothetical protein
MPRRVSARCISDLALYIRSYTKLKIQTSNRLSKTFYERLPAKLLSHNNPFITKHSPYMRKYITIHYVYPVGLSDFIYYIHKYMLKLIKPSTFLDCRVHIFVFYILCVYCIMTGFASKTASLYVS